MKPLPLFAPRGTLHPDDVRPMLERAHYLGKGIRGVAYSDQFGVMVFSNPTSRMLPHRRFVELARWCIESEIAFAGSRQWSAVVEWLGRTYPIATTVVSYSDPAEGHTGALYRACNWLWAPTWHRLRPPPSGGGDWGTGPQAPKDRWVFPLRRDPDRAAALALTDSAVRAAFPWAEFREPNWKRNRWHGGGGDFAAWCAYQRSMIVQGRERERAPK